ncbi:MAG: YidH family protein [Gammaproteobacteria bacterium]
MHKHRDHMANERTFLAWIRTGVGIMAFGFVVEKFSLFIKELGAYSQNPHIINSHYVVKSYSAVLGLTLLILGSVLCLLAFFKYKKIEKQIDEGQFHPTLLLDIMLVISLVLIGILLVIMLVI